MKYRFMLLALAFLSLLPGFSCANKGTAAELAVSAGANFTDVLKECAALYEAEHPGAKIVLNFASTGVVAQQIIAGAPVDVFFSATEKHAEMVAAKGLAVEGSRRTFLSNEIVVITRKGLRHTLSDPAGLLADAVKIVALGSPENLAAGIAAKEALAFHGIHEKVAEKAAYGETVRQVLDYVVRGEADAGIVFYTDYLIAKEKVDLAYTFSKESHRPIIYPVLAVTGRPNEQKALEFVEFLSSEKAKGIFTRYGYRFL